MRARPSTPVPSLPGDAHRHGLEVPAPCNELRDRTAKELGLDLRLATNQEARDQGVTPFSHGAQEFTRIMKTKAARSPDEGQFDIAVGGARRDEERSRAKERIFSLREAGHRWGPHQRPEFWHTVNNPLTNGQTMRCSAVQLV